MEIYDRWVIGIGSILLSSIAAVDAWVRWRRGKASSSWPTTTGEILSSKAVYGNESYRLKIKYRYRVNGREFIGRRISFYWHDHQHEIDATYAAQYLPGARVPVHYNPEAPRVACLETGAGSRGPWIFVAIGAAIFFAAGLFVIGAGFKNVADVVGRYFFAVFFPCLSLLAACFVWFGWKEAKAGVNWPTTTGEILQAKITRSDDSIYPNVKYRYLVNNREYEGRTLTHQIVPSGRDFAEAYLARFPIGAKVDVYYDPESPANSTLEVGTGQIKHWFGACFVVTILFLVGVALWIWDFFG